MKEGCLIYFPFIAAALINTACSENPCPAPGANPVITHQKGLLLQAVFADEDRRIIRDYYFRPAARLKENDSSSVPGKSGMPNRSAGGSFECLRLLPPGSPESGLPADLERKLAPLPRGYSRIIAGADIIIVYRGAGIVTDVIRDAIPLREPHPSSLKTMGTVIQPSTQG